MDPLQSADTHTLPVGAGIFTRKDLYEKGKDRSTEPDGANEPQASQILCISESGKPVASVLDNRFILRHLGAL